ncbi:hypothetical protein BZA05DRAFT_477785 [Tricharina praecox]|uniref:uncharacterized protein n=1 Tax=Tricharina praecox TaxID=43433 RepID=UPI0022211092|nr:uncharacterized protein BZA05DRAFT_477785 [Tricharina praecox]KAI5841590.1 hypothetical protein BZA05DRAFT_477785 [Tricharina praecox]
MASTATTFSSSSPSARSFLRRIRSKTSLLSLRSPRRSLTDFHVQLNDPHRVYSPTDFVAGFVCVTVERPLPLTHLTVSLIGRVDVQTSMREPSGRKRGKSEWAVHSAAATGDGADGGILSICRDELVLCGEGRLEPGVYKFGFELEFCKLPGLGGGLPTSIDFEKGSISYTVSATITRPNSVTPTSTSCAKISMMDTIDIALYPLPKPRVIRLEPVSRHPHRNSKKSSHPRSCSPSTISSTPSSSVGNLHDTLTAPSEKSVRDKAPITATVELLNAGALRGESVGVKISIQHTKRVKSLNGIILTLMRQTRLDPAGDLDDITLEKGKNGVTVLPAASTFRKDLAQTICPIIIDPETLTAEVKASLRVPEDVFPTITNVPGGAVEFRYWVEVVMDLGGKLNGREDLFSAVVPGFPRPAGGVEADFSKAGGGGGSGGGGGNGVLSVEGGVMIETEHVRRRERSVVSCKFEVIVGSVDSVGRKGRLSKTVSMAADNDAITAVPADSIGGRRRSVASLRSPEVSSPPPQSPPSSSSQQAPEYDPAWQQSNHQPPTDSKAQLRMSESTLLPSAPEAAPSEPTMEDVAIAGASAPLATVLEDESSEHGESGNGEEGGVVVVDKAERERQRLLAHESLPPGLDVDPGEGSSAPAAMVLDLDGVEGGLPVYWR